jgi:hypothetical protein
MFGKAHAYHLLPWAWLVAWLLTGVGLSMVYTASDISSLQSRSLIPYLGLSAVGWIAAGFVTASAATGKTGMAVQLVAWVVAYLVAIPLGLAWMLSRDMFPFLLFVPVGIGGIIGGFASSLRPGFWRLASAASVGFVFLLCSTISFIAGYILILIYASIAQRYGGVSSSYALIWILTEAVFGLAAGFAMRWLLGFKAVDSASIPA